MILPEYLKEGSFGEIRYVGSRIDLMFVAEMLKEGATPEQVHEEYPTVPLEMILKTVAFYRDHAAEVDAYVAECYAEMDRNYANYQPNPFALKVQRLVQLIEQMDRERASDPSWSTLSVVDKARILAQENLMEPL